MIIYHNCSRCRLKSPIENFHFQADRKNNCQTYCKPCALIIKKEWKIKNKKLVSAQNKRYRIKHKDQIQIKRTGKKEINILADLIFNDS